MPFNICKAIEVRVYDRYVGTLSGLEGWGVHRWHGRHEVRGAGKASNVRPRTLGSVSAQRAWKGCDPLIGPDQGVRNSSLKAQGGARVGGLLQSRSGSLILSLSNNRGSGKKVRGFRETLGDRQNGPSDDREPVP